jgi:hypothetical protein
MIKDAVASDIKIRLSGVSQPILYAGQIAQTDEYSPLCASDPNDGNELIAAVRWQPRGQHASTGTDDVSESLGRLLHHRDSLPHLA